MKTENPTPSFCATVLLGPNAAEHLDPALESVASHVGGFVLIESGGGAPAVQAAVDKLEELKFTGAVVFADFQWCKDYAKARNFALQCARDAGFSHAVTLDPDERVEFGEDFPVAVEDNPETSVFCMYDLDKGYRKERVIRTDSGAAWEHRVHEFISPRGQAMCVLDGGFREVPKTPDQLVDLNQRNVDVYEDMLREGEDGFRLRWYLARSYEYLGDFQKARGNYGLAFDYAKTAEDRATAAHPLCKLAVLDEDYDRAKERASKCLADHAGFMIEFASILAICELQLGNFHNAARWSTVGLRQPPSKTRVWPHDPDAKAVCAAVAADLLAMKEACVTREVQWFTWMRESFQAEYLTLARCIVRLAPCSQGVDHIDLGAGCGCLVWPMATRLGLDSRGFELQDAARFSTPQEIRDRMTYGVTCEEWGKADQADLVTCLEVLEHIPVELEQTAAEGIERACNPGGTVVFSAAYPGQGGRGHVNEQPKEHWEALLTQAGLTLDHDGTNRLLMLLRDAGGLPGTPWFATNLMVFRKGAA